MLCTIEIEQAKKILKTETKQNKTSNTQTSATLLVTPSHRSDLLNKSVLKYNKRPLA